jgi:hypothetical protein
VSIHQARTTLKLRKATEYPSETKDHFELIPIPDKLLPDIHENERFASTDKCHGSGGFKYSPPSFSDVRIRTTLS